MARNVQARLLAYKAYRLGRDAADPGPAERVGRMAQSCIYKLLELGESELTLRRRLFYTLIIAEIHRKSDPVPFRSEAKEIGQRLKENNCVDPFELYMKIIEATTNTVTAGNYGDFTTERNSLIQDSESHINRFGCEVHSDRAAAAIKLSPADIDRHGKFLSMDLEEIIRLHDLKP